MAYVCTYVVLSLCVFVGVWVSLYLCICMYVCTCTCVRICMSAYLDVHTFCILNRTSGLRQLQSFVTDLHS